MATIAISDLNPSGFELFQDSESFITELSDTELISSKGGFLPLLTLWLAQPAY